MIREMEAKRRRATFSEADDRDKVTTWTGPTRKPDPEHDRTSKPDPEHDRTRKQGPHHRTRNRDNGQNDDGGEDDEVDNRDYDYSDDNEEVFDANVTRRMNKDHQSRR